jgi:tRNA A37 threonylcarbamoyladenosine dehydratase
VFAVEEFADESNWPGVLPQPVDVLIDACDQVRAKLVLAAWALQTGTPLVAVGAAGGKRRPQDVQVDDLARVTHDPLLASLRQRLRKRQGVTRDTSLGVRCVFSREAVAAPAQACDIGDSGDSDDDTAANDGSLNCHGYGSTVGVTATFGMVAANEALEFLVGRSGQTPRQSPI